MRLTEWSWWEEFLSALLVFYTRLWTPRHLLIVGVPALLWLALFVNVGRAQEVEQPVHDESVVYQLQQVQSAMATQTAVLEEVNTSLEELRGRSALGVVDNSRLDAHAAADLAIAKASVGGSIAAMALVGLVVALLVARWRR